MLKTITKQAKMFHFKVYSVRLKYLYIEVYKYTSRNQFGKS